MENKPMASTNNNNQMPSNIVTLNGARRQNEEEEIDLLELAQVLWSKAGYLLAALVIGALIAGIYTKCFITPQYKSTAMVYIYSKSTSITSLTDLQIGNQLTEDFQIIAMTREVIESVIEELGLNSDYEELSKQIAVSNPNDSHIISITVTDPDPERAAVICNAMANEVRKQIAEIMNTDEPSVVEKAIPATKKSSPSTTKNCMMGGLALFVLLAGYYVVQYLLDDTIKTEDDVRKYLGTNVLATIYYNTSWEVNTVKNHKSLSKKTKHTKEQNQKNNCHTTRSN